jgi:hypothetical protein
MHDTLGNTCLTRRATHRKVLSVCGFERFLALFLAFGTVSAGAAQLAAQYRYHYVSLADVTLPTGFNNFSPAAIDDKGRVSGTISKCDQTSCTQPHVVVFSNGNFTILRSGDGGPINQPGTIGGDVVQKSGSPQAALFRGRQKPELIPAQPGETFSTVLGLNDLDTAFVVSYDSQGNPTYVLYETG